MKTLTRPKKKLLNVRVVALATSELTHWTNIEKATGTIVC